ncbi:spore germination protein [Clostridium tagluense]|uniref:spore germination protein n=1 Tax=Clostridium tagluense TaxID=360422 RepID=UPI001C0E1A8D|nr:spore germination protein [Clostridium tagluense]MBU3127815.1 spore germination protein [Clostridium tagluense]MCB2310159.1 spore germination protein [Clostridium tagluense]MCB2315199.1 spore germination protein [Clostridium tagluense]MCB2319859.1 spore germination protein [Clostridium tagluense]MCB2324942.1 spore germination protein [Clostridium tagluense]
MNTNDFSNIKLVTSLDENIKIIKNIFTNDTTVVYRALSVGRPNITKCMLIYIDGMANTQLINENIIKPILLSHIADINHSEIMDVLMQEVLLTGNNKKSDVVDDIISGIIYGKTMLFIDGFANAIIIDTIGWETRDISEPQAETIVRGPREGFTESMNLNLTLIRRRVINPNLKFIFIKMGKQTKTQICVCYIEGIAEEPILKELMKRLNDIDIDGILDSGYVEELIKDAPYSPFRTIINTERPDVVVAKLLEGRFAVICDGSPIVLTLPTIFVEVFQSNEDYYDNFLYSSFVRLLRWLCFFISTSTSAIYVALVTFHQELIPTPFLLSIYSARKGTPFPSIVEAMAMMIIFEILKEAGLRMPKQVGGAISIVGALVLGDAAVSARLVSAPIVIITAITGIASIMLPQVLGLVEIRIIFLLLSSFLGLYGYIFGVMGLVLHMMSIRSFGIPYMLNVPSFSTQDIKDTAIRAPWWAMYLRPKMFSKNKKRIKKGRKKV